MVLITFCCHLFCCHLFWPLHSLQAPIGHMKLDIGIHGTLCASASFYMDVERACFFSYKLESCTCMRFPAKIFPNTAVICLTALALRYKNITCDDIIYG